MPDGEEFTHTVVEVLSSPRGDGNADITVELRDHPVYLGSGGLTLDIKPTYRDAPNRESDDATLEIRPNDLLRLARVLHRAAARAQRLGMIPPTAEACAMRPPDTAAPVLVCPVCTGPMFDNRGDKRSPKAPDARCRDRDCTGRIWKVKEPPRATITQADAPFVLVPRAELPTPPASTAVGRRSSPHYRQCARFVLEQIAPEFSRAGVPMVTFPPS